MLTRAAMADLRAPSRPFRLSQSQPNADFPASLLIVWLRHLPTFRRSAGQSERLHRCRLRTANTAVLGLSKQGVAVQEIVRRRAAPRVSGAADIPAGQVNVPPKRGSRSQYHGHGRPPSGWNSGSRCAAPRYSTGRSRQMAVHPDFEALEDPGLLSKEKLLAGGILAGSANREDEDDVVEDQVS